MTITSSSELVHTEPYRDAKIEIYINLVPGKNIQFVYSWKIRIQCSHYGLNFNDEKCPATLYSSKEEAKMHLQKYIDEHIGLLMSS